MSPPLEDSPEYSADERELLLELAHEAIASALERREVVLPELSPHLVEPRGAFTTIYCRGQLRGCIGQVFAIASLYRVVMETARSAAFDDLRFAPITPAELPDLGISLSVLSPLQPILPEQIEVGRHGLLVKLGGRRGLLLPQVPVERGWDRMTFLEQTCVKAGLPADAWQSAEIEGFTAEVFGESP